MARRVALALAAWGRSGGSLRRLCIRGCADWIEPSRPGSSKKTRPYSCRAPKAARSTWPSSMFCPSLVLSLDAAAVEDDTRSVKSHNLDVSIRLFDVVSHVPQKQVKYLALTGWGMLNFFPVELSASLQCSQSPSPHKPLLVLQVPMYSRYIQGTTRVPSKPVVSK